MEGKRGRDGWKEGNRKRGKLETISNTIPLALNSLSDSTECILSLQHSLRVRSVCTAELTG